MTYRKIGLALAALGLTATLAACSVPEEEPANAAQVAKAQKQGKHRKDKAAEKTGPTETVGQENARKSAESYLDTRRVLALGPDQPAEVRRLLEGGRHLRGRLHRAQLEEAGRQVRQVVHGLRLVLGLRAAGPARVRGLHLGAGCRRCRSGGLLIMSLDSAPGPNTGNCGTTNYPTSHREPAKADGTLMAWGWVSVVFFTPAALVIGIILLVRGNRTGHGIAQTIIGGLSVLFMAIIFIAILAAAASDPIAYSGY